MNRRNTSTSTGSSPTGASRQSTTSRRLPTLSTEEAGHDAAAVEADRTISEEIDEIKRYEDFTTIDWIQDAARTSQRRKARASERAGRFESNGRLGLRYWLQDAWNSGMAWVVVSLVGFFIGLNAAFLNIVTEWLSDIKLGYC
ncbi:MAG: hypothetical protein INR71_09715, partial [Terriglobus roseus]|nr:hypothetical protein [Terriglobus roseus]